MVADIRTGKKVSGEDPGCERTKRKDAGNSEKSLRKYRGQKVTKGHRSIRRSRYEFQPGTIIQIGNKKRMVSGCHNKGALIQMQTKGYEPKDVSLKKMKNTNSFKRMETERNTRAPLMTKVTSLRAGI